MGSLKATLTFFGLGATFTLGTKILCCIGWKLELCPYPTAYRPLTFYVPLFSSLVGACSREDAWSESSLILTLEAAQA